MRYVLKAMLPLVAIMYATPGLAQDVVMRRPIPNQSGATSTPDVADGGAVAWSLNCASAQHADCKAVQRSGGQNTVTAADSSMCFSTQSAAADAIARSAGLTYMPGGDYDFAAICAAGAGTPTPAPGGAVSASVAAQLCLGGQTLVACQTVGMDADGNVTSNDPATIDVCEAQADNADFSKAYDVISAQLGPIGTALRPADVAAAYASQGGACTGGFPVGPPAQTRPAYGGTCKVGTTQSSCTQFMLADDSDGTYIDSSGDVDPSLCETAQDISPADADFVSSAGYVPITSDTTLTQACAGKGADDTAIAATCINKALVKTCYYATSSGNVWETECTNINNIPNLPSNSIFTHDSDVTAALGDCSDPAVAGKSIDIYKTVTQDGSQEGSASLFVAPPQGRTGSNLSSASLGVTVCSGDTRAEVAGSSFTNKATNCSATPPGPGNVSYYGYDLLNFTYTYSLPYSCTSTSTNRPLDPAVPDCARQRTLQQAALQTKTVENPYWSSFEDFYTRTDGNGHYGRNWFFNVPSGYFVVPPLVRTQSEIARPPALTVVDDAENNRFVVTEHFYAPGVGNEASATATVTTDINSIYGAGAGN